MADPIDELIARRLGGKTAASDRVQVQVFPDGSLRQYNPETKTWEVKGLPTEEPFMFRGADGREWRYDPTTGNAAPIPGQPVPSTKPARYNVGGYLVDDQGNVIFEPPAAGPTPRSPEARAVDEAQAAYYQAQTAKLQQEMQPAQQQAIQNYYQTINQIQQLIASGQMAPSEADSYMGAAQAYLRASLQGATPFQQQQETRLRQNMGKEILAQQLSSGAGLANALTSSASSLLNDGLIPAGQQVRFNPLALAQAFGERLGGGPEVGQYAKALLLGSGAPPTNPAAPAAYPETREAVLAQYPELGGQ